MIWDFFSDPLGGLCAQWRHELHTDATWSVHPEQPDPGEAGGARMESSAVPYGAYLKPTRQKNDGTPRAANEKICADLANDLSLPVPPALLYEEKNGVADSEQTVLSLWLADEVWRLKDLRDLSDPPWGLADPALRRASGVIAFDAWVGNTDRNNVRNTIFFERPDGSYQAVFLDFSYTLDKKRRWIDDDDGSDVEMPDLLSRLRAEAERDQIQGTVDQIEGLNEDQIREVVDRIPDSYLDPSRREVVVQALTERARCLREVLAAEFSL